MMRITVAAISTAMAHDKGTELRADTKQEEPGLLNAMVGILDEEGIVVQENGLGFLE
jgi:hypothetical protein